MNDLSLADFILCVLMNLILMLYAYHCHQAFKLLDIAQLQYFKNLQNHQKAYIYKNCTDNIVFGGVMRFLVVMLIVEVMYECLAYVGAGGFPLLLFVVMYFGVLFYFLMRLFVYKTLLATQLRLFQVQMRDKMKEEQERLMKEFGE